MKKIIISVLIMCLIGVSIVIFSIVREDSNEEVALATVIDENLEKMSKYDPRTISSSNPYDYIKDNEYYDNIVALGVEAIDILESKSHNGGFTGLNSYISAIALQEITRFNIYEATGQIFTTSEEFYRLWDNNISSLPYSFESIVNDNELTEKIIKIEKYGIFGKEFINQICKSDSSNIEYHGIKIECDSLNELKESVNEREDINKNDIEYVENYVELKIKNKY